MDLIKQTGDVLSRIARSGGIVAESSLPPDDLIMFRLTNKEFIKTIGVYRGTGESVFQITDKGLAELEEHYRRTGN